LVERLWIKVMLFPTRKTSLLISFESLFQSHSNPLSVLELREDFDIYQSIFFESINLYKYAF